MKRLILIFAALFMVVFTSCEYRTCPTYTRTPSYMKELQKEEFNKTDVVQVQEQEKV